MRWKKLGIVFAPNGVSTWAKSHAMVPTPFLLNDETIRVFVTLCDEKMAGRTAYVDVDARDPTRILNASTRPILDVGKPGDFDSEGVVACSVVRVPDGRLYLYYGGVELCHSIRYRMLAGIAVSSDNGETFTRLRETPMLERSEEERFFRSGPFVIFEGGVFKMWYVAGSSWEVIDGKEMPVYELRYSESHDGITWPSQGTVALPITHPDEHGFGRPWVVNNGDGSHALFYSVRRKSLRAYRMGYSISTDRQTWVRRDNEIGLDIGAPGEFDSDAVMYAAPIRVHGNTWCFYNGNEFGKDGFAVARLVE